LQVVPLQQPPLHAVWLAPPHEVEHRCVDVLHVEPDGQSAAALQPQVPADRHRWPLALIVQSTHAPPAPQIAGVLPGAQVEPLQQPPLHAVWLAPPHEVLHWCVTVLHALPDGQSPTALQPHTPEARQA
jgi:hypothetical protein